MLDGDIGIILSHSVSEVGPGEPNPAAGSGDEVEQPLRMVAASL